MKIRLIAGLMLVTMLALLLGACVTPASSPTTTPATSATTLPVTPPITTSMATVPPPLGTVEVYVTDAPPDREVAAVLLTISRLEIHRAAAVQEQEQEQEQTGSDNQSQEQEQEQEQEGQGEWIVIDISDNMITFDLLKVKGIEEFFGGAEVAAGKYTQIRLIVDKAEVALGGAEPQEASVPSQELKIVRPFDVKAGETTTILLDFDAERSVIITGSGRIQVKPVVKLSIEMKGASGEPKDKDKDEEEELDEEAEAGEVTVEVSSDEFQDENHISREVAVAVGDLLVVTLGSNPSTGFQWSENATIDDVTVLEQLSHEFIAPQGGASPPPGTSGTEVWTFKVLREGTTTLFMEYGRPWQGGEKGTWTFELEVTVD